jgi:hypothetical protein
MISQKAFKRKNIEDKIQRKRLEEIKQRAKRYLDTSALRNTVPSGLRNSLACSAILTLFPKHPQVKNKKFSEGLKKLNQLRRFKCK